MSLLLQAMPRASQRSSPCFFLLVLMAVSNAVFGQGSPLNKANYTVSKRLLSTENGFASHEIFCGLQDKEGFIWLGTRNGLNRYDGKNCLLFTRQRDGLQDSKVVQLAKDGAGNLFIEYGSTGFQLTTNGKVDVMNAVTHKVRTLTSAFPKMPFSEKDVYWISNDGSDEINFLTAFPFRLWKYSVSNGFALRYEMKEWSTKTLLPDVDFRSTGPLCFFAEGKALVKLHNQATQYLLASDTVIAVTQKNALRSLPVGFTGQNDLLIAYNTETQANTFTVGTITPTGSTAFPANTKKTSADSLLGKYWYQAVSSSDGKSCLLYNADALYLWNENAFLKILLKSEIRAFENLFLYQLFPDNFGNLWLCTSAGVLQLTVKKNRFTQYFTSQQQSIETNSQARGIYVDDSGRVVANVWRHAFAQEAGTVRNISEDEIKGVDAEIKYAVTNHRSTLYDGGNNLFVYNEKKNKLEKTSGGAGSEIWSMVSLNDSLLLLGRTNGFSLYNSHSKKFDTLLYGSQNIPEAKFVYRFFKDEVNTLWAVAENGLYKITGSNGKWSVVNEPSPAMAQLSLLDAYADGKGIFWLATNGEGMYRWDKKNNAFQQFTVANGLPSDVLYRIEPDAYNNLWISSDYGLIRFKKETFTVNTYTIADGISHNEFNRTSSFRRKDGRLYFGGLDGVNAFNPGDFTTDSNSLNAPLRVIAFSQFDGSQNKLVNKTAELLNTAQILVAPGDEFFILEFQLLDFAKDEVHNYAYKIEGLDKEWNYVAEPSIRISGLPYGKFTLHIKAQNREGAWSKSELAIPLLVSKPFYLEWWFIALIALVFAVIVYRMVKFRTKQLAADKVKLEKTVEERTTQLKQSLAGQAELLQEKDVLMKEIHHRVKNNLQVISGLLELQSKSVDDGPAKAALMEGRNRVRSIALIHQNLYGFDNISLIDLNKFVQDLCLQVESVFKKGQPVTINISVPDVHLDIDTAVPLGLIMNELLTNSFKYAFNAISAGEIDIQIQTLAEGRHELVYSDNGPGLPSQFNVGKATTLGIQLINDLSRQIGGKVEYVYTGNRAVFTINFSNRSMRKSED